MSIVKKVINKEYNQLKEELTKKTWEKLDDAISSIDKEMTDDISEFSPKSE